MTAITWYDHSAFRLESNGASVIIDPFFAPDCGCKWTNIERPDLVLVTHDHGDHAGNALDICKKTGAMLGCLVETAAAMKKRGLPENRIYNGIGFNIGGTLEYKGIKALMTQAFHSSESGRPVGYIITMPDGFVVYHSGDTGIFAGMSLFAELYPLDLALLPIGGTFTMDAFQAANACKLLRCPRVIPMHWGTFPVLAQNTLQFRETLKNICPSCECVEIKRGQSITLAKKQAVF